MELSFRSYADADAAAVADLWNEVELHVGGHPGFSEAEMRGWAARWPDPAECARVVVAPDGSVVAAGVVETPTEGIRVNAPGLVAPRWRGRGIGRALLAWQWETARARHAETAPDVEWIFDVRASAVETEAARLYARHGMTPSRYWFDMVAPTGSAVELPAPEGLRIVAATDLDPHLVHRVHMETFREHFGFEYFDFDVWTPLTVASPLFRADLSRLAYDGSELAGYVLAYDEGDPEALYVGQVGTRAPWRGRGLAAAMLSSTLVAAGKAGLTSTRLGVDASNPTGAVGVYERAGFVVETESVTYSLAM